MNKMVRRYRVWRARRQLRRRWQSLAPEQHLAIFIQLLNQNEPFRKAMRKALRVKGAVGD